MKFGWGGSFCDASIYGIATTNYINGASIYGNGVSNYGNAGSIYANDTSIAKAQVRSSVSAGTTTRLRPFHLAPSNATTAATGFPNNRRHRAPLLVA